MKIKATALLLAMLMCLSLFAGCQSSELGSYSKDAETATPSPEAAPQKDYSPAYKAYKPDEVMLTINGTKITWDELFYWYVSNLMGIEGYIGPITDWDAESAFAPGKTNREFFTESALESVTLYTALESKAAELGITLSEEDKASVKAIWDNNVKSYGDGDEDAFREYLKKIYLNEKIFNHMNEVSVLFDKIFAELYGAKGEKIPVDEVLATAADMGYLRAKHILLSNKDEAGTVLSEEKLAEKKATAEKLLAELKAISDPAAREARFDALIAEKSEDSGAATYTDGYTFLPEKMVEGFSSAVKALKDNEMSEIVETEHGYHIILRLPLSATAAVELSAQGESMTLPMYVAQKLFAVDSDGWMAEAKVETSKAYEKMDIAKVFAKAK
ncbi:MAG: peptidylprolyl isomerase [Oscillospiraceae bacterium]